MHLKISYPKWRPFCPGGDELTKSVLRDVLSANKLLLRRPQWLCWFENCVRVIYVFLRLLKQSQINRPFCETEIQQFFCSLCMMTSWQGNTLRIADPSLQWRHNGRDGVSNHQPRDCLLNRRFMRRSKKTLDYIKAPRYWPFVRGIHRAPVNSPHKWPVTRKMFPFDDVIMWKSNLGFILCAGWHHDMETLTTMLTLCEGNLPITGGFPFSCSKFLPG